MKSNLKACREKVGLKQHELAQKLGSDQGRISHYENGRRKPDLETCRKLVAVLNEAGGEFTLDQVFPPSEQCGGSRANRKAKAA